MIIMYQHSHSQSSSHNVLTCLMITHDALQLNFDIVLECLHLANCKLTCLNKTCLNSSYCVHQLFYGGRKELLEEERNI